MRWRNWWRWVHRGCAIVIWGAVVASVVLAAVGSADNTAVFGAKRSRCSPLASRGSEGLRVLHRVATLDQLSP
jgi:hypothetical protein